MSDDMEATTTNQLKEFNQQVQSNESFSLVSNKIVKRMLGSGSLKSGCGAFLCELQQLKTFGGFHNRFD